MNEIIEKLRAHKFILFVCDHMNPLGMVRSLGENRILPIVVLVGNGKLVASSKYVKELHRVSSNEEGVSLILEKFSNEPLKPFLYTGSDDIVACLDNNYDKLCNHFYFFNAGKKGELNYLLSKVVQNKLAISCGFNVPEFEEVTVGELPIKVTYPIITKAIDSTITNWKSQVYLCKDEEELKDAYNKIDGNRILLQKYVRKKNETGFNALSINHGQEVFLPLQLSYFTNTETSFGSSIFLFEPTDSDLLSKIKDIIRQTKYEGIFSIDLLEGEDGKKYFLEINFRNSAWSYPYTSAGVNLLLIWAISMKEKKLVTDLLNFKKIPYSAVVETTELLSSKGLSNKISALGRISHSDCLIYWNKEDNKPFWTELFSKSIYRIKSKFVGR